MTDLEKHKFVNSTQIITSLATLSTRIRYSSTVENQSKNNKTGKPTGL